MMFKYSCITLALIKIIDWLLGVLRRIGSISSQPYNGGENIEMFDFNIKAMLKCPRFYWC